MSAVPRSSAILSPEGKVASLLPDARCFPRCPTWVLVNGDSEPEIQRCDACWQNVEPAEQLTDTEAGMLEVARDKLREARTFVAHRRELAIRNRRTALVADDTLISPCCRQLVHRTGVSIVLTTFDIEHDHDGSPIIREVVVSKPSRNAEPDLPDPRTVVCSKCGRLLQLPAGFEDVL